MRASVAQLCLLTESRVAHQRKPYGDDMYIYIVFKLVRDNGTIVRLWLALCQYLYVWCEKMSGDAGRNPKGERPSLSDHNADSTIWTFEMNLCIWDNDWTGWIECTSARFQSTRHTYFLRPASACWLCTIGFSNVIAQIRVLSVWQNKNKMKYYYCCCATMKLYHIIFLLLFNRMTTGKTGNTNKPEQRKCAIGDMRI